MNEIRLVASELGRGGQEGRCTPPWNVIRVRALTCGLERLLWSAWPRLSAHPGPARGGGSRGRSGAHPVRAEPVPSHHLVTSCWGRRGPRGRRPHHRRLRPPGHRPVAGGRPSGPRSCACRPSWAWGSWRWPGGARAR
ncbi:hypothetical protein QJS66_15035 [Kocuria rhizophila]|nr:hypothetical protein QJS66_15035 [Kocuria rhizophila]